MVKTYKSKLIYGGNGIVKFDSAAHWLPEDYDGGSEAVAKVVPTVLFIPGCGDPGCDCSEGEVAFVADKRMAATLRNVADLIDANPVDRRVHRVTFADARP
jgi:hypothetical protein